MKKRAEKGEWPRRPDLAHSAVVALWSLALSGGNAAGLGTFDSR
jgi:hypothetical protein